MAVHLQPAPSGGLTIIKSRPHRLEWAVSEGRLVRDDDHGHHWRGATLWHERAPFVPMQQRILAALRDHVHPGIPRTYYRMLVGHDIHLAAWGELFAIHNHVHERDPFTGRDTGWAENLGRISQGKVTTAFRDFLSNQLRTDTTEVGDFKFHEVGLSATAEANTDTALVSTTGIARVTGTQAGTAPDYTSVATVTADTTETWQEHGLFSQSSGATLMDRSVYTGIAVVNLDTVQFTYTLTQAAEA